MRRSGVIVEFKASNIEGTWRLMRLECFDAIAECRLSRLVFLNQERGLYTTGMYVGGAYLGGIDELFFKEVKETDTFSEVDDA